MTDPAKEIRRLRNALELSVQLQSRYAAQLNQHDSGERIEFQNAQEWIDLLERVGVKQVGGTS